MNSIVCLAGPTASGKTALAVELAKDLNGEVVSCDSMQVYRRMDIGTAMQAIGYKEFVNALEEKETVQQAAEEVKKASRHYAKRQLTWFRRNPAVRWLVRSGDDDREILASARQIIRDSDN